MAQKIDKTIAKTSKFLVNFMASYDEQVVKLSPENLSLRRYKNPSFFQKEIVTNIQEHLKSLNFHQVGTFKAKEISGTNLNFLSDPDNCIIALVMDTKMIGVIVEYMTPYEDATTFTYSNMVFPSLLKRPPQYLYERFTGMDFLELLDKFKDNRPNKAKLNLSDEQIPEFVKTMYKEEVSWRREQQQQKNVHRPIPAPKATTGKLWERLGIGPRMLDKNQIEASVNKSLTPPNNPDGIPTQKSWAVSEAYRAACCSYVLEDMGYTKHYGKMAVDNAIDFFYSDWREKVLTDEKTIDPSWWKKRAYWNNEFHDSILWAMCLGMWDMASRIAQYPDMECYCKRIQGSPEIAYLLLLAAVLRGDKVEDYQVLIDEIEKGVKKKEKLLWGVLKPVVQKDKEVFNKTLLEYLKYYKKRETINSGINNLTAEGTILFNLAKHKGLDVEFPAAYRDHYICLK